MDDTVLDAGRELGKSLAKILQSEKYNEFSYGDVRLILSFAYDAADTILKAEEINKDLK